MSKDGVEANTLLGRIGYDWRHWIGLCIQARRRPTLLNWPDTYADTVVRSAGSTTGERL